MSQFIYLEKIYDYNGLKLPDCERYILLINLDLISKIKVRNERNKENEYFNQVQLIIRLWIKNPDGADCERLFNEESKEFLVLMRKINGVSLNFLIEKANQLPEPPEVDPYEIPF